MTGTAVGDTGACSIAAALGSWKQLTHLRLCQNGIADYGLNKLMNAMEQCESLEFVDFSGNEFGFQENAFGEIHGTLGRCKQLIDMYGCTDEAYFREMDSENFFEKSSSMVSYFCVFMLASFFACIFTVSFKFIADYVLEAPNFAQTLSQQ